MTDTIDPTPENTPPGEPAIAEQQEETPAAAATGTPLKSPSAITVRAPSAESMWEEIVIAVNYLTRLNLKVNDEPKPRFIRKSMGWFPLVGACIGIAGGCVDWIMTRIGLPGIITAAFAVISMLWITRALHEEEFASMANEYGKSFDKQQGVGWLKEERSVQYGTLSVIFVIIMKIGAIASLSDNEVVFSALIASSSLSRAMMVVMAAWLRPLAGDPVADYFQRASTMRMIMALALGTLLTFAALGSFAGYALATAAGAGLIVALLGANHLRGYNGPLMGTLQEIVEISVLGVILALQ